MKRHNHVNTMLLVSIGILVGVLIMIVFKTKQPEEESVIFEIQENENLNVEDVQVDDSGTFVPDVFVPKGSIVTSDTPIDFNRDGRAEHVIVYEKASSLDSPLWSGYIVVGKKEEGWSVLGASGKEVSNIVVGKFTASSGVPSVLIIETLDTTKNWHVLTWSAGALATHSGSEARNGVLNSLGYVFNGKNDIVVSGNNIIEHIPGYSSSAPLCCPDLQTLSISYKFTGNAVVVAKFEKSDLVPTN